MHLKMGRAVLKKFVLMFQLFLLLALSGYASAEIIDDISLKDSANGEVDAVIRFSVPIQYSRHFPLRKSPDMAIYFNILGSVPRDEWQNYESHRSPASEVIRGFTITTRDLSTGPKIEVYFARPVEFSVSAGRDDRSILLHIKPDAAQQNKEQRLQPSGGAAPIVPPASAAAPSIPAVPPVAVQQSGLSQAAAATAQPAAVPQAVPAAQPKPAAQQSPGPQLGGNDGLPVFPPIEQAAPESASSQPAETPTLAEQIEKANKQAAIPMAKGRDAILAGQMFAAIEAFNNVLNLPPNKYSPAAQVWIGIAREKSGQQAKAKLEYELYLKLYPAGADAGWVRTRLGKLNAIPSAATPAVPATAPVRAQPTEFQTSQYGSISTYYYHGASQTSTVATIGTVQTPTTLSLTDQSSLISNVSLTARSYNNEFDNRFVFQDFNSKSFLKNQSNQNRLNAAYFDVKNRIDNYSARIGRQSAMGGGVLGRFDGIAAGYGFMPNWRANIATGQLSDKALDAKPTFVSLGLDFGVTSPLGGSVYFINQRAGGLTDRQAVGGNLRYFEQGMTAMAMLDYDTQIKALNIFTLQGTLNSESGTDYNFYLDRRRTPSLSIRSAVNGATYTQAIQNVDSTGTPIPGSFTYVSAPSTVSDLLQNGFTMDQLAVLAKQRTAIANSALLGITRRLKDRWQVGTDIGVSNTSSMPESGTDLGNGITGREGYLAATPSSGNIWTISGRLSGSDVLSQRDMTLFSLGYSKSQQSRTETLLFYNHAYPRDLWIFDSTLRLTWQSDNTGGKSNTIGPVFRAGYLLRSSLTVEAEGGLDWTKATPAAMPESKTTRKYFSFGFRWDL